MGMTTFYIQELEAEQARKTAEQAEKKAEAKAKAVEAKAVEAKAEAPVKTEKKEGE